MRKLSVFVVLSLAASGATGATPDLSTCDSWQPAPTCNYSPSNRPSSSAITYVVIHKVQGSAAGAASWFQNCAAGVSAHYAFNNSTGYCYQSVREKDIAWHCINRNTNGIGIEHGGYVTSNDTATVCYDESAVETRSCITYYGVDYNRSRIVGHSEVPGNSHTDPGVYWNWTYYMSKCDPAGGGGGSSYPRRTAGSNWKMTNYNASSAVAYDFGWGSAGRVPLAGDWDGDGDVTPGTWDDGHWVMSNYNSSGGVAHDFGWGVAGQMPVVGDWDSNGTDTPGTYETNGTWKLSNTNAGGGISHQFGWGGPDDWPIAGDWNGDGQDNVGTFRNGTWKMRNSHAGGGVDIQFGWGVAGQEPIIGDWNNDGVDTVGTKENVSGGAYFKLTNFNASSAIAYQFGWGLSTGIPIAGDWNNDGTDTVGLAY